MSTQPLSESVALRIGLAARVLPDTDPRRLMAVLVDALKTPLTEEKLGALTVRKLREAADGDLAQMPLPELKQALDYLWGKAELPGSDVPEPKPYRDGDMPGSIRIAVASNEGTRLDGHFGTCARYLIYQVNAGETRLVDVRAATPAPDGEDKNAHRAAIINDCQVLYVVSIGGPAAAKVVRADIHPVKVPAGDDADVVAAELSRVLGSNPPPWLAKVMGVDAENRVRFERSEEEQEA